MKSMITYRGTTQAKLETKFSFNKKSGGTKLLMCSKTETTCFLFCCCFFEKRFKIVILIND